jgi:hypothetical protein
MGKTAKKLRIVHALAEIRTQYLLNTSLVRYCYANSRTYRHSHSLEADSNSASQEVPEFHGTGK